jgi:hypothetical protein
VSACNHLTYDGPPCRFIGCTATSSLLAQFAVDDVQVRRLGDMVDTSVPGEALGFLWTLSRNAGPARPFRMARMVLGVKAVASEGLAADCEVGARLAARFGFPNSLETALLHAFERWDGRGLPPGLRGEAIPLSTRLATLGFAPVMFDGLAGRACAIEAVRRWSGRIIDPDLAQVFLSAPDEYVEVATPDDAWEAAIASEPHLRRAPRANCVYPKKLWCSYAGRRWCTMSVASASPPACGTNQVRSADRSGRRCVCRPSKSSAEAATILRELAAPGGGLDPNACNAVLAAAGERAPSRRQYPAGLTERELPPIERTVGRTVQ